MWKKRFFFVTPFTKASLKTRPYHIQSKPTLFPGIFIAERKRAKSWSKGSASERAKVRGSVHAALRAHKRKARKVRVHFQSSNSSVVLYLIFFDTCVRARASIRRSSRARHQDDVIEEERIVREDFRDCDYLWFAVLPVRDRRNERDGK